ncbi:hypothetical protein, partial [uncultured Caldilinea sp.]|uniref:hypothetical protein n=1 Tax=uncultured Caldilinea sp. TaxID=435295 RepID=UPI0026279870
PSKFFPKETRIGDKRCVLKAKFAANNNSSLKESCQKRRIKQTRADIPDRTRSTFEKACWKLIVA